MEKFFYKRISNYIKTCSTTPNTGKFARVKGWAKKHKCSIACDYTTGRLIKTRSNKKFKKFKALFKKLKLSKINDIHKLEVAKYMFKTIKLHSGTTPSLFIPLSSLHNYYTSNSTTNFFIKRSNTELGKNLNTFLGKEYGRR